jgi:hypothetical protein
MRYWVYSMAVILLTAMLLSVGCQKTEVDKQEAPVLKKVDVLSKDDRAVIDEISPRLADEPEARLKKAREHFGSKDR